MEIQKTSTSTESQLRYELKRYECKEHLSAWLLIASLLAEVVANLIFRDGKSWREIATFCGLGLVVGVSVLGEVWFANRGASLQSELNRRSSERVASAELRAAELEKEAAEIRKSVEQRIINAEQTLALKELLFGKVKGSVKLNRSGSDPEAFRFSETVRNTLMYCGISVTVTDWHRLTGFKITNSKSQLGSAIVDAFASIGFEFEADEKLDETDEVTLTVGSKWPSFF